MNENIINKILIISGFVSLISGVGYLLEKLEILAKTIPFLTLLFVFCLIFVSFFILFLFNMHLRVVIEDLSIKYEIKILNEDGDSLIRRLSHIKVNRGFVKSRLHTILGDSPMTSIEEVNFRAWDNIGNNLYCDYVLNSPTSKKIEVSFPFTIKSGKKYIYNYEYFWKKLCGKHDYYLMLTTSIDNEFHIILPKLWNLQSIEAIELFRDGTKKDLIINLLGKENCDNDFISHKYTIRKTNRNSQIKVDWHIE